MTKHLKIVFLVIAVLAVSMGTSHAGILGPLTHETIAQEGACTCFYNDAGPGIFSTLNIPADYITYQLGAD